MPYCPGCGVEYRPGFAECSDCQAPLVDEPVAGGASRLDGVSSAADAVFAALYGFAGLFCLLMAFVFLGADAAPNAHPNRTPGIYWFLGSCILQIVAILMIGLKNRRRPRA